MRKCVCTRDLGRLHVRTPREEQGGLCAWPVIDLHRGLVICVLYCYCAQHAILGGIGASHRITASHIARTQFLGLHINLRKGGEHLKDLEWIYKIVILLLCSGCTSSSAFSCYKINLLIATVVMLLMTYIQHEHYKKALLTIFHDVEHSHALT